VLQAQVTSSKRARVDRRCRAGQAPTTATHLLRRRSSRWWTPRISQAGSPGGISIGWARFHCPRPLSAGVGRIEDLNQRLDERLTRWRCRGCVEQAGPPEAVASRREITTRGAGGGRGRMFDGTRCGKAPTWPTRPRAVCSRSPAERRVAAGHPPDRKRVPARACCLPQGPRAGGARPGERFKASRARLWEAGDACRRNSRRANKRWARCASTGPWPRRRAVLRRTAGRFQAAGGPPRRGGGRRFASGAASNCSSSLG